MNNISWSSELKKKSSEIKKKTAKIKIISEIQKLERINNSLIKKSVIAPDKNLYDAMMSLELSINSLKNVN